MQYYVLGTSMDMGAMDITIPIMITPMDIGMDMVLTTLTDIKITMNPSMGPIMDPIMIKKEMANQ